MTMITLVGLGIVISVAVGLGLIAISDLPGLARSQSELPPGSTYDPYQAEARAYLSDREAA